MTYKDAKEMLLKHQAWARSESPRYADAVEVAIKSLDAWDDVLNQLINDAEMWEMFDVGTAIGLEKAIKIIVQKLKEVEE